MAFGIPKLRIRTKVEGPDFRKSLAARTRRRGALAGMPRMNKGLAPTNLSKFLK
jgi:hypothetical protein